MAFSPDGRWIGTGGSDCTVKVWDSRTYELLHTFRGHVGSVTRLAFVRLSEGPRLVSGSRDHTVKLWDMNMLENRMNRRRKE